MATYFDFDPVLMRRLQQLKWERGEAQISKELNDDLLQRSQAIFNRALADIADLYAMAGASPRESFASSMSLLLEKIILGGIVFELQNDIMAMLKKQFDNPERAESYMAEAKAAWERTMRASEAIVKQATKR